MKKIKLKNKYTRNLCFIFIALFALCLSITSVFAETRGFAFRAFRLNGEIRWRLYNSVSKKTINGGKFITPSDGVTAFCIEPSIDALLIEDGVYDVYTNSVNFGSITGLSTETLEKLELISFYGYGFNGDTSDVAYLATQLEIWEAVSPGEVSYSSGDFSAVDSKRTQIRDNVNNAYITPSFNMTTVDVVIGQEVSLTDTNGVLNLYKVANCTNCTATISGNTLKIKSTAVGTANIRLEKNISNSTESSILYTQGSHQKLMTFKHPFTFYANLNLKSYGGKIEINKVDSKTNTGVAQGQASLKGAVYGIYKSDGTKITEITTNENGYAISDYLPSLGEFYIQEIKASNGYNLDTTKYPATLTSDNLLVTVNVPEKVIEGQIKITKQDNETSSCTAQGEAILKGAIYEIFDKNGTVVDTLTIGSDCTVSSKKLPYGTYTIKEKKASTGYLIDSNIYTANIDSQNKVIEITSKEQVMKGKIKITKQDSETNSCTALGQATLKGAIYNITDINNNIVDTITIGDDCTAISKDLPYGNYKIKEKTSSQGYELDKNVYSADINSNSITINITSKEDVIKNFISILKQYDYVDGTTQFLNAEANITFEIFYPDGTKVENKNVKFIHGKNRQ